MSNSVTDNKYEYTMQLLAAMASINLAQQQKISRNKAFSKFIKSQTGKMLFDKSTDLWMNGPDYIADEYRREMAAKWKRGHKRISNLNGNFYKES